MATNFDGSSSRSKFKSNQIERLRYTQQFVGNGIITDFTLTFECFYGSNMAVSDSSEIEVYENGLKLERFGGTLEYQMIPDGSGYNKVIHFTTAPLAGHLITAEYRIFNNKS
jgi:hypothetical protein